VLFIFMPVSVDIKISLLARHSLSLVITVSVVGKRGPFRVRREAAASVFRHRLPNSGTPVPALLIHKWNELFSRDDGSTVVTRTPGMSGQ
jgi:hypothetical protein